MKPIIVAFSGGADSTCLLHWSHIQSQNIVAVHVHHGLRAEADNDALHCKKFCLQQGIDYIEKRVDVNSYRAEHKLGIEEAARILRYQMLHEVFQDLGAEWIYTGHTQDDSLETMLFHMARGTGLKGLAGIPRFSEKIQRPILDWTRQQTEEYCLQHDLNYVEDAMNHNLEFSRVKIRKQVLPAMLEVHPGCRSAMLRLGQLAQQEDAFLDSLAAHEMQKCEKKQRFPHEKRYLRSLLLELDEVVLRRGIRHVAYGFGVVLGYDLVDKVVQGIKNGSQGAIHSEKSFLTVVWNDSQLKFLV